MTDEAHRVDRTTVTPAAEGAPRLGGFEPPNQLHMLFANLTSTPDRTAKAVLAGEFAASGIGDLGNLFRLTQKLDGEVRTEAFSSLLELGSVLWAANHLNAAVALIEQTLQRLDVPAIYEDRMRTIISDGHAEILIVEAEKTFATGDSDKALRLAAQIPTSEMQEYTEHLRKRAERRRRGRIIAFASSGVAMVCLAGFFVSGIFSAAELIQDPPEFSLPEFPDTSAIRTIATQSIGDLRQGTTLAAPVTSEIDYGPSAIPLTSETVAVEPENAVDVDTLVAELSEHPGYTCALGQAITTLSITNVPDWNDTRTQETLISFATAVNEGCNKVDVAADEIELLIQQIPDEIVAEFLDELLEKGFAE